MSEVKIKLVENLSIDSSSDTLLRVMVLEKSTMNLVGTVSFESSYFTEDMDCFLVEGCHSWITMFDLIEDDQFDGVLGEHDEEDPKILTFFKLKTENSAANAKR